jgi:hypothetical protein
MLVVSALEDSNVLPATTLEMQADPAALVEVHQTICLSNCQQMHRLQCSEGVLACCTCRVHWSKKSSSER